MQIWTRLWCDYMDIENQWLEPIIVSRLSLSPSSELQSGSLSLTWYFLWSGLHWYVIMIAESDILWSYHTVSLVIGWTIELIWPLFMLPSRCYLILSFSISPLLFSIKFISHHWSPFKVKEYIVWPFSLVCICASSLERKVMQNVLAFPQMGNFSYHVRLMGLLRYA